MRFMPHHAYEPTSVDLKMYKGDFIAGGRWVQQKDRAIRRNLVGLRNDRPRHRRRDGYEVNPMAGAAGGYPAGGVHRYI